MARTNEQQLEAHNAELFGRVEALEGYLQQISDALQEDRDDDDTLNAVGSILMEAGFHA